MASLNTILHHVVLPDQLPKSREADLHIIEQTLLKRLIDASGRLLQCSQPSHAPAIEALRQSLITCQEVHDNPLEGVSCLDKDKVIGALRNLKPHQMLILYLTEQNGALLIRHGSV